uniref:Uncharacterized protein n=2 Tax=Strombidium inclinatum TaxID=197538 RepID=A0A7S3IIV2_9SPIT|mmetsp:Transcript_21738/g.33551  ORF Transcript_21738/g.33551 Transcript_21738/m.33551 type:complete len:122 (+) Transcript_21738:1708-2073(+)
MTYSIFNMCGLVNIARRFIERRAELTPPDQLAAPAKPAEVQPAESSPASPKRTSSSERKKAALDFLDEEIQSLNKKQKKKLDPMEQKILAGLSKKASESSGQGVQGDLEFNDLEISFDEKL